MRSFTEFLTEGRDAPLYHGTGLYDAIAIIRQGGIEPRTAQNSYSLLKTPYRLQYNDLERKKYLVSKDRLKYSFIQGVSTSRSLKFSRDWGIKWRNTTDAVVLVLDQRAIAQKYEIKAYNFHNELTRSQSDHSWNEYEEFIITKKPLPIKYITKIYYTTKFTKAELERVLSGLDYKLTHKIILEPIPIP